MPSGRPGDQQPWPFEEEGQGPGGEPGPGRQSGPGGQSWRGGDRDTGAEAELAALAERQLARLATLLPAIVSRQVPVRALTPGPAAGTVRMRLADSTTLLVTAARPGEVVRVVRALEERHPVTITAWGRGADGLVVELTGVRGREPARLRVLGPDQPD